MAEVFLVDVRDMLCAQALAVVAKWAAPGRVLDITTNAEDVRQDLAAWSHSRQYAFTVTGETARITIP